MRFRPANEGHACAQPSVQATGWPQPESPNNAPNTEWMHNRRPDLALFGIHVARRFLDQMHPRAEPELRVDVGEVGLHGAG